MITMAHCHLPGVTVPVWVCTTSFHHSGIRSVLIPNSFKRTQTPESCTRVLPHHPAVRTVKPSSGQRTMDHPYQPIPLEISGQPQRFQPAVVQYVTTEGPKDHIIWSLLCFVYCNPFCFGLLALINSIKARDRKRVGDVEGAQSYGTTARIFNIVATILFCITVVVLITTFSTIIAYMKAVLANFMI